MLETYQYYNNTLHNLPRSPLVAISRTPIKKNSKNLQKHQSKKLEKHLSKKNSKKSPNPTARDAEPRYMQLLYTNQRLTVARARACARHLLCNHTFCVRYALYETQIALLGNRNYINPLSAQFYLARGARQRQSVKTRSMRSALDKVCSY